MVKTQIIHQYIVKANFQCLTSNPVPILPKPVLWFQIPWGDLIIIPLIMSMLRSNLYSFQLNLTLNLFQIHTPLLSNQFMMMKCTIFYNSSTQNMMIILWVLTSICFSLDWWSPTPKNIYTVSTVLFHKYGGENVVVTNCMSHFSMFFLPSPLWNWLMETRDMLK